MPPEGSRGGCALLLSLRRAKRTLRPALAGRFTGDLPTGRKGMQRKRKREACGGGRSAQVCALARAATSSDVSFSLLLSLSYADACRDPIDTHCGCPKMPSRLFLAPPRQARYDLEAPERQPLAAGASTTQPAVGRHRRLAAQPSSRRNPHRPPPRSPRRPSASSAQNPSCRPTPSSATATINPPLPTLDPRMLVVPFSLTLARNSSRLRFLLPAPAARVARVAMSTSPQAAATVSVEYAKSGRSTCKGCSGAIASGALRLGVSARDPRGFDATKWYHVACFPSASHPLGPVESINGFDSIKEADREELHELEKNPKREHTAASPLEEPSPKKVKTQTPAEGVSDKASVSVEYAKSGRSTCKGCSENIAKGTLRLGASFHDSRGFENTKWYHVACFPTSSYPVFPVENLKGFDSVEDHDREKLQKLAENHKSDVNAADQLKKEKAHSSGDSKDVTEKNLEEVKNPLGESGSKKVKTHMSSPVKGRSEKVSVLVEYAKSGRSTCKGCSENIAKGSLRLGASAHDPRGYDSTKWYHVACFPASSYPVFPVESLKGFDSIKSNDREKLQELEENYKRDGNAADQTSEPNLKVDSMRVSKEGAENNLEEVKLASGNNRIQPVISFSVSDVNKDYKGATLPTHWKAFKTVIFREQEDGLHSSTKIAAFDFDGCLAKTSVRIIGADKWSLQYKSIPEKMQRLYIDGYKLVIFTNESNIDRWKNKRQEAVDSKVGRLDNFIECVKVPVQVFIACGLGKGKGTPDDPYRKPNPGMWWLMAQHFNSGIDIDMDKSFYVGDAAGRENDHSDADIEFAKAIGLKFHVPEEYFGP